MPIPIRSRHATLNAQLTDFGVCRIELEHKMHLNG